ncbi:intercellular adhesion molecule 1 isoform X4 [Oryctolagus cuniculus]|uniref:intercellular adhesion molecule 1 isoform X4 n=1 Tax=Oryctolagus cuniculus TaxID=9986 RepID=UPI00222E276E|nr:intercellular adhesion molecule 5 isoform X4 [Oryctolagus cuniculus]
MTPRSGGRTSRERSCGGQEHADGRCRNCTFLYLQTLVFLLKMYILFGVWGRLASLPRPGSSEELFEVSLWPNQTLVEFGQPLMVNCSTTCPEPGPGGIETLLKKTQVDKGPQWKEFLLEDVTENSVLQCFFSCAGIQKDTSLGITVYKFSESPQIWGSSLLEVGVAETVSCELAGVFPAGEVTFHMFLGDQELNPFLSWEGDTAWANATIRAMETGALELSCLVALGLMEQKTRQPVHVYSFPPPVLEIEDSYPLAGTDVNVTCSGHVLSSPSPTIRLQGATDLPAPGDPAWLLLTAREEDDGRNFSCEAFLEVQGRQLIKTAVTQLHVFYEPRLEESSCPSNQTWVEGMEQVLACVPKGNPTPALVCTWNGIIFDPEVPQKAAKNHTGIYCCTATNKLGSVSKDIAIVVEGLEEGISSSIFLIIIAALGVGVITIALYLNYGPCKIKRRRLRYRPKEGKEEESQLAAQQAEKCSPRNC